MNSQELIPSVSIEGFLQKRHDILSRFQQIQALVAEVKALGSELDSSIDFNFSDGITGQRESIVYSYKRDNQTREEALQEVVNDFTKKLDRYGWRSLMNKSGNMTYMDSKAREDWEKGLKEGTYPELTYENVLETFRGLHANRQDIFHRSVVNVFKSLTWCYKTNQPYKFGKKIILSYCTRHSRTLNSLDDLNRAFCVLDKKPEPAYEQSWQNAIPYGQLTGSKENEYMILTWYKKGTGHVVFKRMDLVEQLNKILHIYFPNALAYDRREAA